jgi:hypothetical protein
MELTELEICTKIADSLGFEYRIQNGKVLPEDPANVITDKLTDVFNPLTDKALCYELITSEGISRQYTKMEGWFYNPACRTAHDEVFNVNYFGEQKAACLAMIAKHREPTMIKE